MNRQTAELLLICLSGTALLLIRSFYQSAQH